MSAVLIPSPVYTEPEGETVAERIWRCEREDAAYLHLYLAQNLTRRLNMMPPTDSIFRADDEKNRHDHREHAKFHLSALIDRKVRIPALLLEMARAEGVL